MSARLILYVKSNSTTPSRDGFAVCAFPVDHVFSPRELATTGYPLIFGNFALNITEDEEILVSAGRRKVDNVTTPTALVAP